MPTGPSPTSSPPIDPAILEEAADWLLLLQSGDATPADRQNLERWKNQGAMHQAAWQRAESVLDTFHQASHQAAGPAARRTLSRLENTDRRRAMKTLALLLLATPTAWVSYRYLPWYSWQADLYTHTGEQRTLDLADGTHLVMNTATAVDLDFSERERRLTLRAGEILLTTSKDPAPHARPLVVDTPQGRLRALGTRFAVRQLEGETLLSVFEGAVEISPIHADKVIVPAGQQRLFSGSRIRPSKPVADDALLWEKGMLLARDMPLRTWVEEIGRYRNGILRCDPEISDIRVSGAFPLNNTDASLDLLRKTLPVEISRVSPWWITLRKR
ncbi:FecR domain-containing protein [Alcanivorax sp. 24]|uniref:FecR domain-containing protein n=1 Tax=Alcanivorax sp. 24 TaxID=2545266 RepID=UPI00105B7929|nr:FecR family protein [Alcanivorax sp. 24]